MEKYLIANRGIVATSFIKTLNRLNKSSFLICSREELDYYPPFISDNLILVDTHYTRYLEDEDLLIKVLIKNNIEGFIPGYGFKSQNSLFAIKCNKNGIKFIGPEPEKLEIASNKSKMKEIAAKNSISIVKSSMEIKNFDELKAYSTKAKFPIILKPVNGWGSHNIKIIQSKNLLEQGYNSFMKKMQAFKGYYQKTFIAEEYLEGIREIEIPYISDYKGNYHLLEPVENTIQKNRKKILSVSPVPNVSEKIIDKLKNFSEKILKAIDIKGVGVIEFFIDDKDELYFNEINPTLPFNFPLIEEKNRISLTEVLIDVFEGKEITLPNPKDEIVMSLNIIAEDIEVRETKGILDFFEYAPERNSYLLPVYRKGERVSILYDPLVGTLIVSDVSYDKVKKRGLSNLETLVISGVGTNINNMKNLLDSKKIFNEKVSISGSEEILKGEKSSLDKESVAMIAATIFHHQNRGKSFNERTNFIEENLLDKITRKIFG
jgi:biotin carboxylase